MKARFPEHDRSLHPVVPVELLRCQPEFLRHFYSQYLFESSISVDERGCGNLSREDDLRNRLGALPPYRVFFRCVQAVSALHRIGYSHGGLKLTKFILVRNRGDVVVKLSDFTRCALVLPAGALTDSVLQDLTDLQAALVQLLVKFRPADLDHRLVSLHKFVHEGLDNVKAGEFSLEFLLTHPAVRDVCDIAQFASGLSDHMSVAVRDRNSSDENALMRALHDVGGDYYREWLTKPPFRGNRAFQRGINDSVDLGFLIRGMRRSWPAVFANQNKLCYVLRMFRNKLTHCEELVGLPLGVDFGDNASAYTTAWLRAFPLFGYHLWESARLVGLDDYFPCFFRVQN